GGSLLAAPGLFMSKGSGGGGGSEEGLIASATSVTVALDAAVLQDGALIGPDESRTVDDLKAHKTAADAVVARVHGAEQSGQDPIAALHDMAYARPQRG